MGGQWKRSKLAVIDRPGLRPTPDRVRETLFNWLGQTLDGWRVLDAFAGTGVLGFEAASRGAAQVRLIERDGHACRALRSAVERLGADKVVSVTQMDALSWMAGASAASLELILLDPPYAARLGETALQACRPLLAAQGRVYLEDDQPWDEARLAPLGWTLLRSSRAGTVHAHLLGLCDTAGGAQVGAPVGADCVRDSGTVTSD